MREHHRAPERSRERAPDHRTVARAILLVVIALASSVQHARAQAAEAASKESSKVSATDSTTHSWLDRVSIDLSGASTYQPAGAFGEYSAPEYFEPRRGEDGEVRARWRLGGHAVSDNPLIHVATSMTLGVDVRPLAGVRIRGEIVGEHRGFSYGVGNVTNIALIPRVSFAIDTSFDLFSDTLGLRIRFGDIAPARFDEGLMVYNVDIQGITAELRWRSLRAAYRKAGDLYRGIGLGIQDFDEIVGGIDDVPIGDGLRIAASIGAFSVPGAGMVPRYAETSPRRRLLDSAAMEWFGQMASARVELGRSAALYAQSAVRAGRSSHALSRSAYVVGARTAHATSDLELDAVAEYRFYGGLFNAGLRNTDVYYRDPDGAGYGNTVGPVLYPLGHYDRPFSQWAVFTEYQNLKDVAAATVRASSRWQFSPAFALRGMLDVNYVKAEGVDGFLYPFFTAGVAWEPSPLFHFGLSMTNRAMNLDNTYPTLYLVTHPVLMFTIRWRSTTGEARR